MTTLSVVIPAYNEEDGIDEIAQPGSGCEDSLKAVGISSLELLVVDDGSKDRTAEITRRSQGVR
jgi:glycosyltransferase involved in cell wall biosynthesis